MGMSVRKSVHPRGLPAIHPGLEQRIREAEEAEIAGKTPRRIDGAQRILRPTVETTNRERAAQMRTLGLVDPVYVSSMDGLAAIAEQQPFRPGENLDLIWDSLSEAEKIRAGATERFRLEMEASLRLAARYWTPPHQIGGRLDARNTRRGIENIRAEIAALDYLLAPDSLALLQRFLDETQDIINAGLRQRAIQGLDAVIMHDLLRDLVQKLIYQELTSRRRAMGDRGIRRIAGNIDLSEQIATQLKRDPTFTPRERLLLRIVHVHQDLGYTAYAARSSFRGGRLHRAYGARIFTDEVNRYRPLLSQSEIDLVRSAVATHSGDELPFASARLLAIVRAVDHLAPFAPHRVYAHLARIEGARDYLDDLLMHARTGDIEHYRAAKESLRLLLDAQQELPQALRDDILAAFRALDRDAERCELGSLAGNVTHLRYEAAGTGSITATLEGDEFAERYQVLFDQQQDQLVRLALASAVSEEALTSNRSVRLGAKAGGALVLQRA